MTPADITASAAFREGLARRLAELGLVPPDPKALRLVPRPESQEREAAGSRSGGARRLDPARERRGSRRPELPEGEPAAVADA
jgi:hypothetical protein